MDFQPFKTCVTRVDFLQVRTCLQALPRAPKRLIYLMFVSLRSPVSVDADQAGKSRL